MIRHTLYIILIALFVTGCAEEPGPIVKLDPAAPCEEIIHPSLLSVPFDEVAQGKEQVEEWILTHFPTATIEFLPSQSIGETEIGQFSWWADGKLISLYLWGNTRYVFHRYKQHPTLGHIIRCFGEPESYTLGNSMVGGEISTGVLLELWYPDRGLYFSSLTWGLSEIRRYDTNSPLYGVVRVMPPGTVEEMRQSGNASVQRYHSDEDALLREWPEDFTELVFEE